MNPQFRPTEQHTLHFDFSYVKQDVNFTFHHSFKDFSVKKHTPESIVKAKETHPSLRYINDDRLTHFIDVDLPADVICLTHVTYPRQTSNGVTNQITQMGIHTPQKGKRKFYDRQKENSSEPWTVHPKLNFARKTDQLTNDVVLENEENTQYPYDVSDWQGVMDTSVSLLYQHNALISLSADNDEEVPNTIIDQITKAIERTGYVLPDAISDLVYEGEDWCTMVPALDTDGNPLLNEDGDVIYTMKLHPDVQRAFEEPLKLAVKYCSEIECLEGQTWSNTEGGTSDNYDGQSESDELGQNPGPNMSFTKAATLTSDETNDNPYKWTLTNHNAGYGLDINSNVIWKGKDGSDSWVGNGSLSTLDMKSPFTDENVQALLDGDMFVQIDTPDYQNGLLRGYLEPTGDINDESAIQFKVVLDTSGMDGADDVTATGTGSFTLNEMRTSVACNSLKIVGLETNTATAFVGIRDSDAQFPLNFTNQGNYPGEIEVTVKNAWLRHLSAYVQFLDQDGHPFIPKNWDENLPEYVRGIFQVSDYKKYIGLIQPVTELYGVPLGIDDTVLTIPVPDGANSVEVLLGGLGSGHFDSEVCWPGLMATCLIELALPVMLLAAGNSNSNTEDTNSIMDDPEMVYVMGVQGQGLLGDGSSNTQDPSLDTNTVISVLTPILVDQSFALGKWVFKKMAAGAAERCIPFIDAAKAIFDAAVTAAQLAQTSMEVAQSPAVFKLDAVRAIDLQITLTADKEVKKFPDQASKYQVSVVYSKSALNPVETFDLPVGKPLSDDIITTFSDVPAGGFLRVYVFFYSESNWLAGQGCTDWIEAKGTEGSTLIIKDLEIKNNLVPLSADSVYWHKSKIAYNEEEGHYWDDRFVNKPPQSTPDTNQPFGGAEVKEWNSITMSQSPAMMAYDWMASDLPNAESDTAYTVQNLSTLEHPEQQYSILEKPTQERGGVLYDMAGPDDGYGLNFFIDASSGSFDAIKNIQGGFHLRRVALKYVKEGSSEPVVPPSFEIDTDESYGRFPVPIDKFVKHPQGYVYGISYALHKLFHLKLPLVPTKDKYAPMANCVSGEGVREGLMRGPKAIALGLDGILLILESVNHRIQAFDTQGKPVPYFTDPSDSNNKTSLMSLTNTDDATYLDLAVEGVGYIYVLRHSGIGTDAKEYAVDLYKPDGTFLVTTPGVAAAKITVSLMRNIFTLNYETIMGSHGRVEPSVSMWVAPAPKS